MFIYIYSHNIHVCIIYIYVHTIFAYYVYIYLYTNPFYISTFEANQSLDARCAPLKVAAQAMRTQQQRLRTEAPYGGLTWPWGVR